MRKNMVKPPLLFVLVSLLSGCSFGRINGYIQKMADQLGRQKAQITALQRETEVACGIGQMDEETCESFQRALTTMNAQTENWTREIVLLSQKNAPLRAPFLSKPAEEMVLGYAEKHQRYTQLITAMTSLLRDESKMRPFETAAYFPPGKYEVPDDKIETLRQALKPTLEGIMRFKNEYPYFPCTGKVEVNGYADRTGIREGSGLYEELKAALKLEAPTRSDLNRQLSHWRAEGIGGLFKSMPNAKEVVVKAVGKGEQDPPGANKLSTTNALRDDDPRRRIVVVYWGCPADKIE